MIPRSLGGRLLSAFALLALAIVIAVGGALFVALRGLHQDSTLNSLSDVVGSVLPQVRDAIGAGQLRGTVLELRDQIGDRGYELVIVGGDGHIRPIAGTAFAGVLIDGDIAVGGQVSGTFRLQDGPYLYVATGVRRVGTAGPKGIAVIAKDQSGALALADLGRTIPVVIGVILLIATPLAIALSRSVTRPLRRIAAATADIPSGRAQPLPLEGPSEVRELTGTFNAVAGELDATRRRESELLANLRHDLRTPLTVITGFAAALRDGTATGKNAEAAAKAIEEEAARLERMVAEVGAIERIRSGEEQIRPEMLDAADVIAETATRFGARATAAGVELATVTAPGATLTIAADRVALDRMLGNLVENALDATPAGGHIVIQAGPSTLPRGIEAIHFDVLDDGPGFPAGTADRAFERFWRADPARAGTGSGLGLAIVRELAVAHGGVAHAENQAPHGARVGFTLPRVPWPGVTGRSAQASS
jgi:two-component system, OmpR family, sensor histidine kinase MprB